MVGPEDPGLVVQKRLKHGDGFLIIPQNAVGAGEIAARVQSVRVVNAQGAELTVQNGLEYLNGFLGISRDGVGARKIAARGQRQVMVWAEDAGFVGDQLPKNVDSLPVLSDGVADVG